MAIEEGGGVRREVEQLQLVAVCSDGEVRRVAYVAEVHDLIQIPEENGAEVDLLLGEVILFEVVGVRDTEEKTLRLADYELLQNEEGRKVGLVPLL